MSLPTASALERALACPASCVLPHVLESSEDADRGSEIHKFVRSCAIGMPREKALALVPEEHRAICSIIDVARVCMGMREVRAEVSYAVDVDPELVLPVRTLGVNLGRNYPPTSPTEFAGTNDIEGWGFDDTPHVRDVKTGEPVTACAENPQMQFHALARYIETGAPEVSTAIVYIGRNGQVRLDPHVFTAYELDVFHDELRELKDRIDAARARYEATGEVTVSSGSHCKYCPAMVVCPRYTALARTMATDLREVTGGVTEEALVERLRALTPTQQGIAWEKAKEAEKLVELVLDGLKAIARQAAFPLPGGTKQVGKLSFERTDFSQGKAVALLLEKGATPEEIQACSTTSTVEQVRAINLAPRALASAKPRRKKLAAAS